MSWRGFMAVGVLGAACSVELAPVDRGQPPTGGAAGVGALAGAGGVAGAPSGGAAGTTSGGSAGTGGQSGGAAGQSAGAGGLDASIDGDAGAAGSGGSPGAALGNFALGYYWATTEAEFPGTADTNLYDSSCTLIATVTASFATSLESIGTGKLADGRVLAYDGTCNCPTSPCYVVCDAAHPWGYGVQGKALVPFRSVAVNPAEIAYGTSVYAPALDGLTMPGAPPWGGFVHDGCLSADDNGGTATQSVSLFSALKADYQKLSGTLGSSLQLYQGGSKCP